MTKSERSQYFFKNFYTPRLEHYKMEGEPFACSPFEQILVVSPCVHVQKQHPLENTKYGELGHF